MIQNFERYNKIIGDFMEYGDDNLPIIEGAVPYGDFSNSWDWLMPVVEKINDMIGAESLRFDRTGISIHKNWVAVTTLTFKCTAIVYAGQKNGHWYPNLISAVYNIVVAFIIHYHKTKK